MSIRFHIHILTPPPSTRIRIWITGAQLHVACDQLLEGGGGRMFDVQFNFLNDVGT